MLARAIWGGSSLSQPLHYSRERNPFPRPGPEEPARGGPKPYPVKPIVSLSGAAGAAALLLALYAPGSLAVPAAAATPPPTPPPMPPPATAAPAATGAPAPASTPIPLPSGFALPGSYGSPAPGASPGATPAPPADARKGLEGVWEVQIQRGDKTEYTHFNLKQNGASLTGTYQDSGGHKFPIAGSVDGPSIRLIVSMPDGTTILMEGRLDGTTDMLGMFTTSKEQAAFTATYRPKEKWIENVNPSPGGIGTGAGGGGYTPPR